MPPPVTMKSDRISKGGSSRPILASRNNAISINFVDSAPTFARPHGPPIPSEVKIPHFPAGRARKSVPKSRQPRSTNISTQPAGSASRMLRVPRQPNSSQSGLSYSDMGVNGQESRRMTDHLGEVHFAGTDSLPISLEPTTVRALRKDDDSGEWQDDDYVPRMHLNATPQRHHQENRPEQEQIDTEHQARRNIPRRSHRRRPRYTTGEGEYLRTIREQEEARSMDSTPRPPTPSNSPPYQVLHTTEVEDDMIHDQEPGFSAPKPASSRKFVIGIDYGTTFSSMSAAVCPEANSITRVFPHEIITISDWPLDYMGGASLQVPTETWHSSRPITRDPRTGRFELSDSESDDGIVEDIDDEAPRFANSVPVPDRFRVCRGSDPPVDSCEDNEQSPQLLWGYECQFQKYHGNSTRNRDRYIDRLKLVLVGTEHTQQDRDRLEPRLEGMIDSGIVRHIQDCITDYFVPVLQHTRRELIKRYRYTDDCSVLFSLAVPTIWSPKSSRILQLALEEAIRITGFGTLIDRNVTNLFVVTEPKAAAAYLLGLGHADDLQPGSTFVVLDCGGGTVDGSTYDVAKSASLRLGNEICEAKGDSCGASYLNENFRRLLLYRLQEDTYLDAYGASRESLVDDAVSSFEIYDKRRKDVMGSASSKVKIPGLRGSRQRTLPGNTAEKYLNGYLLLFLDDFQEIFLPVLNRVARVLDTQLEAAIGLGREPTKVFIVGGFGGAVSIRTFLNDHLSRFVASRKLSYNIDLVMPTAQECVTAVSAGAVMQALNPEEGIPRKFVASYGFIENVEYKPRSLKHANAEPWYDKISGQNYVEVIGYFVKKGEEHPQKHKFSKFTYEHSFDISCKWLRCEEVLYVSYGDSKTGYEKEHQYNKDAHIEGKIVTDFNSLRDEGKIQPVRRTVNRDGTVTEAHYKITYDLVPYLDGRDLKYKAYWPSVGNAQLVKEKQICIASAFQPGTT